MDNIGSKLHEIGRKAYGSLNNQVRGYRERDILAQNDITADKAPERAIAGSPAPGVINKGIEDLFAVVLKQKKNHSTVKLIMVLPCRNHWCKINGNIVF